MLLLLLLFRSLLGSKKLLLLSRGEAALAETIKLVQAALGVLQAVSGALQNLLGRIRAALVRVPCRDLSQVLDLKREKIIEPSQAGKQCFIKV